MCDYSLHAVASRPARVGERLVTTQFPGSITRGFASESELSVAVCLLPGTEIAFDADAVRRDALQGNEIGYRLARFRQIDLERPTTHHDALEFPDGQVVLVTQLAEGQRATVLQLPSTERPVRDAARKSETEEAALPVV
ncbi:MAG TPA: hypothetical protein VFA57_09325 [Pseudolabrys sp.]|nr:hypothetical protein [Pseudolabrys sp.]